MDLLLAFKHLMDEIDAERLGGKSYITILSVEM